MPTVLDTESTASVCYLIEAMYGSTTARFARWTEDISYGGNTYTALPKAEIEFGAQDGLSKDVPVRMRVPTGVEPFESASKGTHAPITIHIDEIDPEDADPSTTYRQRWWGTVAETIRHPGGNAGVIELRVAGIKASLALPLGVPIGADCPWPFGDPNTCGYNLEPDKQTVEVTAISGRVIEADALVVPRARYFHRGYVEREGLRIRIAEHNEGDSMKLSHPPPASWLNQDVTFVPGCDQRLETCKLWGQELNFGGAGFAIPDYHPSLGSK